MPEITEIAGKIAGIISFIAFIPYIVAILRKKTRPNRASWWIWTVLGITLGTSYYFSGAEHTIWVPVSYAVGPFIVAILSIKYGEGGWNRFDLFCLGATVISLVLWALFRTPLVALFINLFIDLLGALPTIKKTYKDPKSEDPIAWILFFCGNTCNLFAIEELRFAILAYPVYMFLVSSLIMALVVWPRNKKTKTAS